jgi:hypothetical protein
MTLRAKPCDVIQPLETRTPMAAIFSSPTHTPVSPALPARLDAEGREGVG